MKRLFTLKWWNRHLEFLLVEFHEIPIAVLLFYESLGIALFLKDGWDLVCGYAVGALSELSEDTDDFVMVSSLRMNNVKHVRARSRECETLSSPKLTM